MNQPADLHEYLVISRGKWDENASPQDVQAAIDRFYIWHEQHQLRGTMKRGSRLTAEGKTVSKLSISDGPFAETKELVGGYWFIMAPSLDEAAAIAAENPCLAYGLTLEIRPLDPERCESTAVTNETPDAWRKR
ncbi:MAG: YciI family protein [Pirellulales bacterium]